jgi:hypothetical protein
MTMLWSRIERNLVDGGSLFDGFLIMVLSVSVPVPVPASASAVTTPLVMVPFKEYAVL